MLSLALSSMISPPEGTDAVTAYQRLLASINRTDALNRRGFDPATALHTPTGRWGLVHYGVMIPNLPAPLRYLDAIVVLGTARARVFDNRPLVATTAQDSAWWLLGSGLTTDSFRQFSGTADCDLAPDGSHLRLGDAATIDRDGDRVTVEASHGPVSVELALTMTPAVSHFAHLPGLYDHWSVLCAYNGRFAVDGEILEQSGLCTYEYARAVNLPLPFHFFTYQILNVDPDTQVLMVELLGPRRLVVQRTVYIRSRDGSTSVHTSGYQHTVHEHAPEPLTTPDGTPMTMPRQFTWHVAEEDGTELITIEGTTNHDWSYGLGAGYAGSYNYTGTFRGKPITGTGYIEWIDRR